MTDDQYNKLSEMYAKKINECSDKDARIASLESQIRDKDEEFDRYLKYQCVALGYSPEDVDLPSEHGNDQLRWASMIQLKIIEKDKEIERLKDTVKDRDYERFHRDAYFEELREALRESISYIEGRNHGIEGVSLLDRCRKLIGD